MNLRKAVTGAAVALGSTAVMFGQGGTALAAPVDDLGGKVQAIQENLGGSVAGAPAPTLHGIAPSDAVGQLTP